MISKFHIPFLLPGLNDIIRAAQHGKGVGSRYVAMKRLAGEQVSFFMKSAGLPSYQHPVDVHFVWIEKNRKRDKDNVAAGGRKIILDALVNAGIIDGDGWRGVNGFTDKFTLDPHNPGVTVEIALADDTLQSSTERRKSPRERGTRGR